MCQQSSSCPPLPGSLCSGSAFSVTFQSANAVLASRALRRDLLTGESHLPHDFSCLFSPLATCQSPLLLSLLFATHPKKRQEKSWGRWDSPVKRSRRRARDARTAFADWKVTEKAEPEHKEPGRGGQEEDCWHIEKRDPWAREAR